MATPRPSPTTLTRRWRRDRRGATAVEFALVAGPLVFMIFALIQLSLYFMVQVTLDSATAEAARELRTGHDSSGNPVVADGMQDTNGQQAFVKSVCNNMSWLSGQCASNITVDIRPLNSFSASPGSISNGTCFYSGSAGSAVELRTYYKWQMVVAALMTSLQTSGAGAGVAQLQAAEVFQVEPNGQANPDTQNQC